MRAARIKKEKKKRKSTRTLLKDGEAEFVTDEEIASAMSGDGFHGRFVSSGNVKFNAKELEDWR